MADRTHVSSGALRRDAKAAMFAVATSAGDEMRADRVRAVMEARKARRDAKPGEAPAQHPQTHKTNGPLGPRPTRTVCGGASGSAGSEPPLGKRKIAVNGEQFSQSCRGRCGPISLDVRVV